jgi:hypothetical protein
MNQHLDVKSISRGRRCRAPVWSVERNARLGFLMGAGLGCGQIARAMASTEDAIRMQASRLDLSFRDASEFGGPASMLGTQGAFQRAAMRRHRRREVIVVEVLEILDGDPNLIDNVLDDQ